MRSLILPTPTVGIIESFKAGAIAAHAEGLASRRARYAERRDERAAEVARAEGRDFGSNLERALVALPSRKRGAAIRAAFAGMDRADAAQAAWAIHRPYLRSAALAVLAEVWPTGFPTA